MEARSDSPMDRGDVSPGSQETGYIPVRVLGRGAFGEAVLYRKVEAGVARHYVAIEILRRSGRIATVRWFHTVLD